MKGRFRMRQKVREWFSKIVSIILTLITSTTYAANCASKEYVDQQAAGLQAQINTLSTIPAVAHPVGSCYGGGVVYYASTDANAPAGQRGLIAAPTDAQYLGSFNITWQQTGSTTVSTKKTYFTGESNTNTILATPDTFPAAIAANSYTVDGDTCTACTSWYLPSQDELVTLYAQSTSSIALGDTTFWSACNGTTPGSITNFWSSTQNASNTAFSVSFSNGTVNSSSSSFTFHVRAVRAF